MPTCANLPRFDRSYASLTHTLAEPLPTMRALAVLGSAIVLGVLALCQPASAGSDSFKVDFEVVLAKGEDAKHFIVEVSPPPPPLAGQRSTKRGPSARSDRAPGFHLRCTPTGLLSAPRASETSSKETCGPTHASSESSVASWCSGESPPQAEPTPSRDTRVVLTRIPVPRAYFTTRGIPGKPSIAARWKDANIKDDPVVQSNVRGTLSYAMAGPGTRTTQCE